MFTRCLIRIVQGLTLGLLLSGCGGWSNLLAPSPSPTTLPTYTPTAIPPPSPIIVPTTTPLPPVLLEPRTVDQIKQIASWRSPYGESIKQVAWSPDGRSIAALTANKSVLFWETSSGRELKSLSGAMNAIAFSPDSRLLAAGAENNAVILWEISSGRALNTFTKHSSTVMTVAFSPDGNLLLAGSAYGPQKLWNVVTGNEAGDLDYAVSGVVLSSAFSPDGKLLALGTGSSRGGGIELWDVAKLEKSTTLFDSRDDKQSLAFSPDGKVLASGSLFGNVKLWDLSSGRELKNFAVRGGVSSVAFSPDGQLIAAARGQEARLLNVASGRELRSLAGQVDVNSVAFSPDGRWLAIGSQDGMVKLWGLQP